MGQATIAGPRAAEFLETLMPGDVLGLKQGRQRYSYFTTESAGISDDFMVSHVAPDTYFLVVNAGRKADDFALLRATLPPGVTLEVHSERALIAVQGPRGGRLAAATGGQPFMSVAGTEIAGVACLVSRSGYTGEDGFEISCPSERAMELAERLLADKRLQPVGLGAPRHPSAGGGAVPVWQRH